MSPNATEPSMPWTKTARHEYARRAQRYLSDLTDRKWADRATPARSTPGRATRTIRRDRQSERQDDREQRCPRLRCRQKDPGPQAPHPDRHARDLERMLCVDLAPNRAPSAPATSRRKASSLEARHHSLTITAR